MGLEHEHGQGVNGNCLYLSLIFAVNLKQLWKRNVSLITSWQTEGEKVEAVTDFIFLASKITADSEGSHKINRHVLLGKKHMTDLDSVFNKQRHHFADNFPLVKAMVFPVVMYRCESGTIKKAECQRTDAFKLWCWRRLLRVRKSVHPKGNESWIFTGRTDAEAETPILWPPDAKNWLMQLNFKFPGAPYFLMQRRYLAALI